MSKPPRIILLHATPVAIQPVRRAFEKGWPDAEAVDLLDSSLSGDRAEMDDLSSEMIERFVDLGRYGFRTGADGILVTCSAFGPAIDQLIAELPVPVLKPNDAMFREAIGMGNRIGMLATFAPAVSTMTAEFHEYAADTGATLDTIIADGAIDALRAGDDVMHNTLVADRAGDLAAYDAIMLAHFSTSRAAELVRQSVNVPVLTAPDSAVARMRQLIEGGENQ
jgi:aspartate/glutamate racemase